MLGAVRISGDGVEPPRRVGIEMSDTWTVTVDRERCMGSGICLVYAAGTFGHDEEAKAIVIDSAADPIDVIRVTAEGCPTAAIQLVPNDGM